MVCLSPSLEYCTGNAISAAISGYLSAPLGLQSDPTFRGQEAMPVSGYLFPGDRDTYKGNQFYKGS